MQDHTVKAFDDDITRLRGLIAEMGGLAEHALTKSMRALTTRDLELAAEVIAADARLDKLEQDVDRLSVRMIALRAPMADDLREAVADLKIAGIIERIGDYAKNIAKRARKIEDVERFEPLTLIPAMADIAGSMVHDVLNAHAARDADAALEIIARDEKVDSFYNSIFRNLVSHMMENPSSITTAAHLLFVARNIERIGDHATNIAELVYYAVRGEYLPDRNETAKDSEGA